MSEQLGWDRLRISDAERDRAAEALAEHYAQGRLTTEEHSERLDRIWAARTHAEIAPVFRDLPGSGSAPAPRAVPAYPRRSRPRLPVPLFLLFIVLAALVVVAHLPWILIGLGVWFFVLRGGCGPRMHRRW
jgi:hypothetical protein